MFKLIECSKNTSYLKCYSNIGVYNLGNGEVILIDSGDHKKSVTDLDAELEKRNLRVKAIFCTHAHIDHIMGNKYFKEKYGCKIYASEMEQFYAEYPNIDASATFNAIPVRRDSNGIITDAGTKTELLTPDVLPEGFQMISLPGHTYNMAGFKTPDDVWFLADSVLAKVTFEHYKLPFFFDINQSIETAKMLPNLKGKLFIPSHDIATEDITDLALYNVQKLCELKDYFYSLCDGKSLEEIFIKADRDLDLKLNFEKCARIGIVIKSFLQALMFDGKITANVENSKLVYYRV